MTACLTALPMLAEARRCSTHGAAARVRFMAPVGCVRYHTADTCIWQTDYAAESP